MNGKGAPARFAGWGRLALTAGIVLGAGCSADYPQAGPADTDDGAQASAERSAGRAREEALRGAASRGALPSGLGEVDWAFEASAEVDSTDLWTGHVIPFVMDRATFANPQDVDDAMAIWEAATSIRFRPYAAGDSAYVNIAAGTSGCSSGVGRPPGGTPAQPAVRNVSFENCSRSAIVHELAHVIGMHHEQTRTDRDQHVVYDEDCVHPDNRHNFNISTTGVDVGLYDFSSVMQYNSTGFYWSPQQPACGSTQFTMWRRTSPPGTQTGITDHGSNAAPSLLDRAAVEEMYGDGMGRAIAVGDFNGDGFRDVAVGSPRAGSVRQGTVSIFRGSAAGLTLDTTLVQGVTPMSRDRFGYALAAGDFNNDGLADLAVGAPGMSNTGRVVLFRGRAQATGVLASHVTLSQSGLSANEVGDRFGYALAAGDFNNDGISDIAVGAPGEGWVGAPGGGAVFIFRGGAVAPSPIQKIGQGALDPNETGDNFGASLARGDFDGDGYADLAVGAPHERVGARPEAGAAYVYRGAAGQSLLALRPLYAVSNGTDFEGWDMLFGFAMTAGDFDGDGLADLAVGAPGATVNGARWAGRVIVYDGSAGGPVSGSQTLTAGATPAEGAAFGYSLDAGMFNGDGVRDLAVGAPGDRPSPNVGSGLVHTFVGGAAGLSNFQVVDQQGPGGVGNIAGDHFGSAVAFANIDDDGQMEMIVGADGERWANASTGRAYVYRLTAGQFSGWTNHGP